MSLARLTAASLLVLAPAIANDTLATLGAGGLTPLKTSTIVMESEDLEISIHKITVRYLFSNTSDHDQDVTVAFPLPELGGGMLANEPVKIPSKDPVNFIDFRVLAGGKPVTPKVEMRAFVDNQEITADLKAMGVPLSPLDEHAAAAYRKAPANLRAKFEKGGWMDCKLTNDDRCWPMWQVRIQYYWTQHFPAKSTLQVEHTYSPVVGGSYITPTDDGSSTARDFCGGPAAVAEIQKQKALHPPKNTDSPVLMQRRIQYIVTTANNWAGPIGSFKLSILPDAASDIVLTCQQGLKRVAPARYEFSRTSFRPDKELDIMILQPAN